NLLAFCTAAGWMTRGVSGAIVALLASALPCSLIALVFTHFFTIAQSSSVFVAALRGALAAAVAAMINTAWVFAGAHVRGNVAKAAIYVGASFLLVSAVGVAPFKVLLAAAAVGLLWPAREVTE